MKSEAVRLAKIQQTTEIQRHLFQLVTHPVLLAIAGYYLSDRLQGDYVKQNLIQDVEWSDKEGRYVVVRERYDKVWDKDAGKLNSGAAFAMQVGMSLYLGTAALKSAGATFGDVTKSIGLLKGAG